MTTIWEIENSEIDLLPKNYQLKMDSGTKQFLRVDKYDIESTNDLNSSDIIDGDKSPRLQKFAGGG